MQPPNSFTLPQITSARYEALLAAAQNQYTQANVSGNSGSASSSTMSIGWTYNPAALTLYVEIFRKPAYMSMQAMQSELMGMLG